MCMGRGGRSIMLPPWIKLYQKLFSLFVQFFRDLRFFLAILILNTYHMDSLRAQHLPTILQQKAKPPTRAAHPSFPRPFPITKSKNNSLIVTSKPSSGSLSINDQALTVQRNSVISPVIICKKWSYTRHRCYTPDHSAYWNQINRFMIQISRHRKYVASFGLYCPPVLSSPSSPSWFCTLSFLPKR